MSQSIDQRRVAVITGAAGSIGRAYAHRLASQGVRVVVNDLGSDRTGAGGAASPADGVVREIVAAGGEAVANASDIATSRGADEVVDCAVDTFGGLDAVILNAGILRDRTLVSMEDDDWDRVIEVHLRGTFGPSRSAARYWRSRSKSGIPVAGRLITTTSSTGLFGNAGQSNYAAAKAGIAGFTLSAALELSRYGVTANGVWPFAYSRMTSDLPQYAEGGVPRDDVDPARIAPFVAWLASEDSQDVTGRFFGLRGNRVMLAEGWHTSGERELGDGPSPSDVGQVARELISRSRPNAAFPFGSVPGE